MANTFLFTLTYIVGFAVTMFLGLFQTVERPKPTITPPGYSFVVTDTDSMPMIGTDLSPPTSTGPPTRVVSASIF